MVSPDEATTISHRDCDVACEIVPTASVSVSVPGLIEVVVGLHELLKRRR